MGIVDKSDAIISTILATIGAVPKWLNRLQRYKVEYVKGKNNVVADYLSRLPIEVRCLSANQELN